jgi:hypothetical protein
MLLSVIMADSTSETASGIFMSVSYLLVFLYAWLQLRRVKRPHAMSDSSSHAGSNHRQSSSGSSSSGRQRRRGVAAPVQRLFFKCVLVLSFFRVLGFGLPDSLFKSQCKQQL